VQPMSRREKPSLEELQRDLLHRTRELHRALIAPEGSIEARPANAPEEGGCRGRQGAAEAPPGGVSSSRCEGRGSAPVSRELMRIADSIERNGLDVQMATSRAVVSSTIRAALLGGVDKTGQGRMRRGAIRAK
jgi:hypothetical protein